MENALDDEMDRTEVEELFEVKWCGGKWYVTDPFTNVTYIRTSKSRCAELLDRLLSA